MKTSYHERDYAYGAAMLMLRNAIGLTQKGLANLLGVSRRAVGEWEAGSSYPKVEHLKQVIALAVKQQAFPIGDEAQEIRALWKVAHQKVPLDEHWLSTLLLQQHSSQEQALRLLVESIPTVPVEETMSSAAVLQRPEPGLRVDWDDALAVPVFYGREEELAKLSRWVLQERTRVVSVLGMGGIGKSTLSVRSMYQLAEHFEVVIFRSLRETPSCEALLDDCLQVFSSMGIGKGLTLRTGALGPMSCACPVPMTSVPYAYPPTEPATLERRISLLLEHLRQTRTLLVLDNLEGLAQDGDARGRLRPGFEGYGQLLRRVAETGHQSCLLLTSRDKLAALRPLESKYAFVRSLRLNGLDPAACKQLLAGKELVGTDQEQERLIEVYGGNPLALKMVAETIVDLFGREIGTFLAEGTLIFGSIADLLDEQFARLSTLEQNVLRWLAVAREPVNLDELLAMLACGTTPLAVLPRVKVLEAVDAGHRRSLIEPGKRPGSFTLQPVMQEYVTTAVLTTETRSKIQQ